MKNETTAAVQAAEKASPLPVPDGREWLARFGVKTQLSSIIPPRFRLLYDVANAVLVRLEMEPESSVFPCSAMRNDLRDALERAAIVRQEPTAGAYG